MPAQMDARQLIISASGAHVPAARDFVGAAAADAGLDERAVHHCRLSVDEVCTNIVEHGYGADGKDGVIDIRCAADAAYFVMTIRDESRPFDPLSIPDPERGHALLERDPGGLGIFFVKRFMDVMSYRYDDGKNELTLKKRLLTPPIIVQGGAQVHPLKIALSVDIQGARVVGVSGRLDSATSAAFYSTLENDLSVGMRVILDLSAVDYISSAGVKRLVQVWQRLHDATGELVLLEPHPRVSEVLEIVGLDTVFTVIRRSSPQIEC